MELIAFILLPLAFTLLTKLVRAARSRSAASGDDEQATTNTGAGYVPPTFRVVALGASGAGKTVFLSSLFHKLNFRAPGRSYYLETDAQQRVALGRIYSNVSDTERPWPRGTREGETREFTFDCVGVDEKNATDTVLRFSCLDYAGELLDVEQDKPGGMALDDLEERIKNAHALLAMIDGHRVLQLLKHERRGHDYFQHSLQPMVGFMQSASCPIHLVLTKWDLVRDFGQASNIDDPALLEQVIEKLLSYEHIKSLVYVHSRNQIVRLIPVSAVGSSFVELSAEGKVVKRSDGELHPTNLDVPLCAVLPDLFEQVEMSLDQSVRRGINVEALARMRKDAGAVLNSVLRGPAGDTARLVLQGVFGRDLGSEASTLFLEWMARRSPENGAHGQVRADLETQLAARQRLRATVLNDFKKTVLRLEAALPNSELSNRW